MAAANAGGANLGGLFYHCYFSFLHLFAIRPQRKGKRNQEMRKA